MVARRGLPEPTVEVGIGKRLLVSVATLGSGAPSMEPMKSQQGAAASDRLPPPPTSPGPLQTLARARREGRSCVFPDPLALLEMNQFPFSDVPDPTRTFGKTDRLARTAHEVSGRQMPRPRGRRP